MLIDEEEIIEKHEANHTEYKSNIKYNLIMGSDWDWQEIYLESFYI